MFCVPVPDLMLTEKCNMRCKYCFEHKEPRDTDEKELLDYVGAYTNTTYFPFGGEPILKLDLIEKLVKKLGEREYFIGMKENAEQGLKHIITNGTLVRKNIAKIKELGLDLQISIDGPEFINDVNRVYADGRGTFKDAMDAIEACKENGVEWSIHGVVNKATVKHIFDISKFMFETVECKGFDQMCTFLGGNCFQIIFEEDFDDQNTDEIIDNIGRFCEWIWQNEKYTELQRKKLIQSYLTRKGGVCGLGSNLMALDTKFNLYPCHRLSTIPNREDYCLGNVYHPEDFKNFKLFNSYCRMGKRTQSMYSVLQNNHRFEDKGVHWFMWCPATNHQIGGNIYYQNPKYNIMHVELNRFIDTLFEKYEIEQCDCKSGQCK